MQDAIEECKVGQGFCPGSSLLRAGMMVCGADFSRVFLAHRRHHTKLQPIRHPLLHTSIPPIDTERTKQRYCIVGLDNEIYKELGTLDIVLREMTVEDSLSELSASTACFLV